MPSPGAEIGCRSVSANAPSVPANPYPVHGLKRTSAG
jgi:hypothetical protein